MLAVEFDRNAWASSYAEMHLETDPGVEAVHYLPTDAGEREIRLVEVNTLMGERIDNSLEAIDFGVDTGTDTEHRLRILDVTRGQWKRIESGQLELPHHWSLQGKVSFPNSCS